MQLLAQAPQACLQYGMSILTYSNNFLIPAMLFYTDLSLYALSDQMELEVFGDTNHTKPTVIISYAYRQIKLSESSVMKSTVINTSKEMTAYSGTYSVN